MQAVFKVRDAREAENQLLNHDVYTLANACFWGLFMQHAKGMLDEKLSTERRIGHGLLAALELLPLVSQVVSLIEYAVAKIFIYICRKKELQPIARPLVQKAMDIDKLSAEPKQTVQPQPRSSPLTAEQFQDNKKALAIRSSLPLGITGGNNNCCVKVVVQLMTNIPYMRELFIKIPECRAVIKAYEEEQLRALKDPKGQHLISGTYCDNIRKLLAKIESSSDWLANDQEDASTILTILLDHANYEGIPVHPLPAADRRMSRYFKSFLLKPESFFGSKEASFFDLFKTYFKLEWRQFKSPPENLLISNDCAKERDLSITGEIMELSLGKEFFADGSTATYACDFFAMHRGTANGGHYTCGAVKINGTWYLLNESRVSVMSAEEAEKELRTATFMNYTKISA